MNERSRSKPPRNNQQSRPASQPVAAVRSVSRGAAIRAQKRSQEDAHRIANQYLDASNKPQTQARKANFIDEQPRLRIIGLGGMDGGGSKNMILAEYMNDAVIID